MSYIIIETETNIKMTLSQQDKRLNNSLPLLVVVTLQAYNLIPSS
jgi:hypothetical protein